MHAHAHTHAHTHVCTYTHTHTHTHTHTQSTYSIICIVTARPPLLGTLLELGLRSGLLVGIITNDVAYNLLTPDSYINVSSQLTDSL